MKNFRVFVFTLAAFLILGFGIYQSISNPLNLVVPAVISAVLLFFGHIDRFKSFKAGASGGIEAELVETVKEANATIDHLRSIALVLGETALWQAARSGRFWSPEIPEKVLDIERKVFKIFDKLGMTNDQKDQAAAPLRKLTRFDYARALSGGDTIAYTPADMHGERSELFEGDPTPEQMRTFLEQSGQLDSGANPEVELLVADFEHYCATGEHRRLDVFHDLKSWPEKYLRKIN